MPRNNSEMENKHRHGGKGVVLFGFLVLIAGLATYYRLGWPIIMMILGVLIILFGIGRMMMKKDM